MNYQASENDRVNDYIENEVPPALKPLFLEIRAAVLAAHDGFSEDIKWKNCLTYAARKNAIQTVVGKDKITLIFFEGAQMKDPDGMLQGDGKKSRSVRFSSTGINEEGLKVLVKQAARLAS